MPANKRPELLSQVQCDLALSLVEAREGEKSADAPMIETADGPLPAWTVFVASTGGANRNGDVIDQNTWKLGPYKKNPQVLWMHNRFSPPLGTGEAWVEEKGTDSARLMVKVLWDLEDAEARKIAGKVHRKVLRAGSMSCAPGKGSMWRDQLPKDDPWFEEGSWGRVIRNQELREFSIVTIPGDENCLQQAEPPSTPPAAPASTPDTGNSMNFRLLLCSVLALSADVSDEDLQAAADAHPDTKKRAEDAEAAIRTALALEAGAALPEDYAAQLASATDRTGLLTLAEANALVLAAQHTPDPKVEALAAVKLAVKEGKIAPALASHFEQLAAASPETTIATLSAMPVGAGVPLTPQVDPRTPPAPASGASVLTAAEKAEAKSLGIDEAVWLAAKKKNRLLNPTRPQEG